MTHKTKKGKNSADHKELHTSDIRYASCPDKWLLEEQDEDHKTPTYDGLKNQHQLFVINYLRCNDTRQAAIESGYAPATAHHRGWTLARRPDILAAIDELVNREMQHAEAQRCQVILRLQADSTVSLEDLVEWDDSVENYRIKAAKDVAPAFRRCIGMVSVSREGNPIFNNTAQNTARKLLASYHGWDRSPVDANAAISFDFRGLKDDVPPPAKGGPKDA